MTKVSAQPTNAKWPRYPTIYEINTWVWLASLSRKYGTSIDLSSVPAAEWDAIAALRFDSVWLMGVWERSPAGIAISNQNESLLSDFRHALPDFRTEDNVGSPYSVHRYVVDQHLGGPEALARAREELARRGLRLLLDFVPNHVAPDHPWVSEHPEYFIRGNAEDSARDPASYFALNEIFYAHGRDPYFPAWPDVLQLNAFHPDLRREAAETISNIASQCDGVRCDMAMLFLNEVFARTWGGRSGQKPDAEYWAEVISAPKKFRPEFLFIAEAYWDLEWELLQTGFDFCYDKRLYDRLEHESAESVRLHLYADPDYLGRLVHFLENHDEPRAASVFSPSKERAAAVASFTLPGARLFHEGQFEGFRTRPPVFLARRTVEPVDEELRSFYGKLLEALSHPIFHEGQWHLCDCGGWPDNESTRNLVTWTWTKDEERILIVVNLSDSTAQGQVRLPWSDLSGKTLRLVDLLSEVTYERSGDQLQENGLYVDLTGWNYHLLEIHSGA